jgi:hypothetical protein
VPSLSNYFQSRRIDGCAVLDRLLSKVNVGAEAKLFASSLLYRVITRILLKSRTHAAASSGIPETDIQDGVLLIGSWVPIQDELLWQGTRCEHWRRSPPA